MRLYLKLAFPLLLAAAAHGATLPSLVQTRFKLHAGPAQQRVQNPEGIRPRVERALVSGREV